MKLTLIYSGGTIGCAGEPLNPMPAADFMALWDRHVGTGLDIGIDWQWIDPPLDSPEMVPQDWARLARLILRGRTDQAVLLLHGTDTMAWTAAALAFLLTLYGTDGRPAGRLDTPVVLTGSQRPLFEGEALRKDTDALANLDAAIGACGDGHGAVRVAFGGEILPGARVDKISTTADRAFDCPKGIAPTPALAAADPAALLAQLDRLGPHLGAKAIINVTPTPTDGALLVQYLSAVIDGMGEKLGAIHLNGYGVGNFSNQSMIAPLLKAAHDRGVLIIAGSQVSHGDVTPSTYVSGHWLAGCGALPSADMATPALHAKLHLAMALGAANGWDLAAMERFVLTPVAGELRA